MEKDIKFKGLTLLSKEEFVLLKDQIPRLNEWWWLRASKDKGFKHEAFCVDNKGHINQCPVCCPDVRVRPVLILKTTADIGTVFNFYRYSWTVISKRYALCNESFYNSSFCYEWDKEDSNNYETSDIKKYLDKDWERMNKGDINYGEYDQNDS